MPVDFLTLVRRDHADLTLELSLLLDPSASAAELRTALDGIRLGLTAHVEAEDIVLGRLEAVPVLAPAIAQARAAHRVQETTLVALVSERPQTAAWRFRAHELRELVRCHAGAEERGLFAAMEHHAPADILAELAGAFATERLRQLAFLQPSAPVFVRQVAQRVW